MPDGAPVEGFEPRETIPQGKRVLRIPPGFAPPQRETVDTYHAVMHEPEEAHERGIVDQFTSRGFTTIQGGTFNASNPLEFGISYDSEAQHLRDRRLAAKLGIDMPHDFTPEAILASDAPVVVKDPASDRGQNKYLLETREQKIKFIAWALLKKQLGELYDSPQRHDIINRILTQVAEGNFEDAFINERGDIDRWIFEEYIDSPGDYNTSVRVVVDALGTIHYAQIARSDAKRGEQLPDASFDFSLLDEHGMLPGLPFSVFLTHPSSPFYLKSKKIVSNIARGGKPLILNGERVEDPADRKILEDLGVDPDNPRLPQALAAQASALGKEFRGEYPIVGEDFMLRDNTGVGVLLEVNKTPQLRPEALGLPSDTDPIQCELTLLGRVLDNLPQ